MPELIDPPRLVWPTATVRESFLVGEGVDCLERGESAKWLQAARDDFEAFVARARGTQVRWGVPSSLYWYVSHEHYLGTLVIQHRLTRELLQVGGHIGFHVTRNWQRQGHATRMLAAGLRECERLNLDPPIGSRDRSS